jgi:hypothetical protein
MIGLLSIGLDVCLVTFVFIHAIWVVCRALVKSSCKFLQRTAGMAVTHPPTETSRKAYLVQKKRVTR